MCAMLSVSPLSKTASGKIYIAFKGFWSPFRVCFHVCFLKCVVVLSLAQRVEKFKMATSVWVNISSPTSLRLKKVTKAK